MKRSLIVATTLASLGASVGAQTIAITGGRVFPVSGPMIENGTVLIRDGRIAQVGANLAIPAGARRIDATGKWVTPGLVDAETQYDVDRYNGRRTILTAPCGERQDAK